VEKETRKTKCKNLGAGGQKRIHELPEERRMSAIKNPPAAKRTQSRPVSRSKKYREVLVEGAAFKKERDVWSGNQTERRGRSAEV